MEQKQFDKEEAYLLAERYNQTGNTLRSNGQFDKAIIYYNKSLNAYPTVKAYLSVAQSYARKKEYDKAIESCRTALMLDEDSSDIYVDIAAYLIQTKQYQEAEQFLYRELDKKETMVRKYTLYNLGLIKEKTGDWFKSLYFYKAALGIDKKDIEISRAYYKLLVLMQ